MWVSSVGQSKVFPWGLLPLQPWGCTAKFQCFSYYGCMTYAFMLLGATKSRCCTKVSALKKVLIKLSRDGQLLGRYRYRKYRLSQRNYAVFIQGMSHFFI